MAITKNNPFGQDVVDFNEETSADRVGRRIRAIRTEKNMTQAKLGEKLGLTSDRIQKYENGARKPKLEMLKQIASALGVETIALIDPIVSNHVGAMFAFFEMEDLYELNVIKDGAQYLLQFGDGFNGTMNGYLGEWYEERKMIRDRMGKTASVEEEKTILEEYHDWKNTFPKALSDKTTTDLQKAKLKRTIAELQEELDKIDNE